MRILLVEDNHRLSDSLRLILQDDGYAVDTAYDGPEGEEAGMISGYDVIILDIMLPGKNGLEVCRELRNRRITTPILMLTARDALEDRVVGLDSGADDYLVKPFEVDELRARIRALLRRESSTKTGVLCIADLELDPATHTVQRGGQTDRFDRQGIFHSRIFDAPSQPLDHTRDGRRAPVELRSCCGFQCSGCLYPPAAPKDRRSLPGQTARNGSWSRLSHPHPRGTMSAQKR